MKGKKLIAPVVVTVLVCVWLLGYALVALRLPGLPGWAKVLGILVPLLLGWAAIKNLVERIHEIRSGEEDDLDDY